MTIITGDSMMGDSIDANPWEQVTCCPTHADAWKSAFASFNNWWNTRKEIWGCDLNTALSNPQLKDVIAVLFACTYQVSLIDITILHNFYVEKLQAWSEPCPNETASKDEPSSIIQH